MTTRDKLIQLLDMNFGYVEEMEAEKLADYLIENGVAVREWRDAKIDPPKEEYPCAKPCTVANEPTIKNGWKVFTFKEPTFWEML